MISSFSLLRVAFRRVCLHVPAFRPVSTGLLLLAAVGFLSACGSVSPPGRGDLHQVALVWLKDPQDRAKIVKAVHDFDREIPEVKSAVIGPPLPVGSKLADTSYDLCFILTFENDAARQRYNVHPVHAKAAQEVFLPLSRKLLFYHFIGE